MMKKIVKAIGAMCLVGLAAMNGQYAVAAESGWYGGLGDRKSVV